MLYKKSCTFIYNSTETDHTQLNQILATYLSVHWKLCTCSLYIFGSGCNSFFLGSKVIRLVLSGFYGNISFLNLVLCVCAFCHIFRQEHLCEAFPSATWHLQVCSVSQMLLQATLIKRITFGNSESYSALSTLWNWILQATFKFGISDTKAEGGI